ncbi:hypothetical protein [Klebsiella sp. CVUAS 10191.3]|uniref:hypothetical protein n=1 Tax=Klebsiella sp. CVUAS 10191.3 TaxID=2116111 RepID=UPI001C816A57|nr:hypothetical protein [Klebsiella sp. CVUAS 10191.3]
MCRGLTFRAICFARWRLTPYRVYGVVPWINLPRRLFRPVAADALPGLRGCAVD